MNILDLIRNSKGEVFYGMHFYPGVAQYDNPEGSFRVFINEATIRKMNQSFVGRPVFVDHVEEVDDNVNTLRNEADGWVVESFYNPADGKTWAKFIVVSDRGLQAIKRGYRLSNAYVPELTETASTWNGVDYQKTVTGGEFEHLAIVKNPRYEESVIMTQQQFKSYNDGLKAGLERFQNSKDKKGKDTAVNFFTRKKLENSIDIANTLVVLPKSKKEMSLEKLVNDHDAILNMNGYANDDHMVKVNDKDEMSVKDLVKAHKKMTAENEKLKLNAAGEEGGEPGKGKDDIDPEVENEAMDEDQNGERDENGDDSLDNVDDNEGERDENGDDSVENEEDFDGEPDDSDDAAPKKVAKNKSKTKNAKVDARKKAAALANAHKTVRNSPAPRVDLAMDKVARGQARYGSN